MEEVMTLKQVAQYFKVSEITIHRLTQRGILPGVKIGRQWRYYRRNIELLIMNPESFNINNNHFNNDSKPKH